MGKFIKVTAIFAVLLTVLQMSACAPSKKTLFTNEVEAWFDSLDSEQTDAKSERVINYAKEGSVAYEYPITSDEGVSRDIQNIFENKVNSFTPQAEGDQLVLGYKMYSPCEGVYGLKLLIKSVLNGTASESSELFNFVKNTATGSEMSDILKKMTVLEAQDRTETALNKLNCNFLFKNDGIDVIDGDTSVSVPYAYVHPYLPEIIKESIPADESIRVVDVTKKMVALTYDDGPHGVYTKQLLDILEENNAVATFYEVGQNLQYAPDQVKRASELGCEIGSHSWSHANLQTSSPDRIRQQIEDTNAKFEEILGYTPKTLRPPYGAVGSDLKDICDQALIGWSVDTLDWKYRNAETVFDSVKNAGDLDGDVVLLHSIHKTTIEASANIIPWLIENGYQLVTVSELIKYKYEDVYEKGEFYAYDYYDNEPK